MANGRIIKNFKPVGEIFEGFKPVDESEREKIFREDPWSDRRLMTVTGQPIGTPAERVNAKKKLIAKSLPFIGDVAGGIAAGFVPPVGILKGASMVPRAAKFGVRMIGSGAGGFAGSAGEQKLLTGHVDTNKALTQGGLSAGGEGALSLAAAPVKALLKKFKDPLFKLTTSFTLTGQAYKKKALTKFVDHQTERARQFAKEFAPDIVKKQDLGIDDVKYMLDAAKEDKDLLYAYYNDSMKALANFSPDGKIPVPNTMAFIDKIRKESAAEAGTNISRAQLNARVRSKLAFAKQSEFNDILETMKPLGSSRERDAASPISVKGLLDKVFKQGKKGFMDLPTDKVRKYREGLKAAIYNDLNNLPEPEDAAWFVMADVGGPEKTGKIVKSKIKADQVVKSIEQFRVINNIFEKSVVRVGGAGKRVLRPMQLVDNIYANRLRIKKEMPEVWPKLKKEAEHFREIAKDFDLEARSAQSGLGEVASRGVGGNIAAFMIGGGMAVPVAEGFGLVSAMAMMDPKKAKAFSKIIEGLYKTTGKAGMHLYPYPALMSSH